MSHCGVIFLQPHRTAADPPCSLHAASCSSYSARRDGVWVSPDPRMLQFISSRLAKVDTNPSMSFFAFVRLKLGLPATQQGTSSQPTTFCSAALTVFLKSLSLLIKALTSLLVSGCVLLPSNDMAPGRMHFAHRVCASKPFILAAVILALFCGQS